MATIDLSGPPRPASGLLDALPRRVSLTLPELRLVAEQAGGAPLPFDLGTSSPAEDVEGRPGSGGTAADAHQRLLAGLHDPRSTLARRGLLAEDAGTADAGLLGAVGLLATPRLALDLDVVVGSVQAKAWHRQSGGAVAALSTVDGIVFELAWFPAEQWRDELARVAAIPVDAPLRRSAVPDALDLPYELADAAAEAVRTARTDLLPMLVAQHAEPALDPSGAAYAGPDLARALAALSTECHGRIRALAADVSNGTTEVVGVVSWVLVADGWRSLRPHQAGPSARVEVRRVDPTDLARDLAPVLAEVAA